MYKSGRISSLTLTMTGDRSDDGDANGLSGREEIRERGEREGGDNFRGQLDSDM